MELMRKLTRAGGALAVAVATLAVPAAAQDWPSGNIDLIIPSSPGGGFDTYGRILGKVLGEQLGVQIVPKNISGGAGMRGAQAAYNARPDGQTFATFNVPGIIQPIVLGEETGYDIDKIDWLGAMAFNQYIVVVAADSPYNTIADLKAAGEPVSFSAYGSSGIAANRILCNEVEIECQIISGYPGNNDALLGVVRGDAVASVTPINTATAFNTAGDLKGLLLMTDRDVADFPDTEKADSAGYPALASLGLIRAFGLPPGVDPEVSAAFEAAFMKALEAEELQQWAADTDSQLDPMNGDELKALIDSQTELLTRYKDVLAQSN
ncbi:Bug family tripartite tricarboxylate transporter substrate binding protein [Chelativorans salis]|uniref:Tripartite tricarboxylate transporter substrate binding protein n=1 Tax=Chelativorans salis TaxID=2978478 RepID=A0ABT2LVM0_9HYPH|nr:tripartite tricarboxylate transporter substrate binding protein [Chelativorans sp. EGI FJ00035]MCT7378149.1 tripartite tricarboxylate transporter substrate binding protein [Chelativorans sp. EGI FJ00035]